MKSRHFLRYAAVLSLLVCAACKPQFIPFGESVKIDLTAKAAPAAAQAAQATVAQVAPKH
ncbi:MULTISPECIES: hypothetical protein [Lysobacter]|jgi:hypothetical protein|uniref:Lipoprotein n=2 Tax=Lysobacter gummosus TaxID=262324 RepID=A0ABY3X440_9GAMM|nr:MULTISPECIES: hypothetical protein [Lysobacter]ALN91680.1 hypothetical protein LG3211_2713 [Lysobacter gummosus]UJB21303.1 hypothetical protein L1A79_09730 [Lysobacter capsici]UJQ29581.1 hypothetical protein L2D09_05130 [Lysobacter gummosus]UNP27362.1 hypothetical protein MOV92_12525 [Lysobacter gummosus]